MDKCSAALIESDLGTKILRLFRYEGPAIGWWTRFYDVSATGSASAALPAEKKTDVQIVVPGTMAHNGAEPRPTWEKARAMPDAKLLAWLQTGKGEYGKYVAPNFEAFFPDDREGGIQLDQPSCRPTRIRGRTTKS